VARKLAISCWALLHARWNCREFAQDELNVKKVPALKYFDNDNDVTKTYAGWLALHALIALLYSYKGPLTQAAISDYITKRTTVQAGTDHKATVKVC
jgi:hypothetical protein